MEHLPPVVDPQDPLRIPYLGGEFDGKDFEGYPTRQGLDLQGLQQGDLQGRSRADVARFLQTWLYFGLLHGVLGIEIATKDFTRTGESDQRCITTQNLRDYLRRWRLIVDQERKGSSDDSCIPRNQRALECLTYSHAFWFVMDEKQRNDLVCSEIGLSIHLLASALEHALTSICDIPVVKVPWRLMRNDFLTQRMLRNGWCPSVIEQICTHQHLAFQYYASLLKAPSKPDEHIQCRAGDAGCKAKNVSNEIYATRHAEIDCKCEDIAVDLSQLRNLVDHGDVPLILVEHEAAKPTLKLVGFEKGMQYTALSHV